MEYKVPLIREFIPPYEEYIERIKTIWDTGWMTNSGVLHNQLELNLKKYLGVNNVSLCVNGHSALEIGLTALGVKGEVITTPYTFISTTEAIIRCGLKPVFCDIDSNSLTIEPNLIESKITEDTVAIMGVHVYGIPCDVRWINEIAEKYNLKVIYDAAHCFGTCVKEKGIASYGDMSMFSFHATKVYNTAEGGAVCYSDDMYKQNVEAARNFGFFSKYDAPILGSNAKMSEFHAAMGLCNLDHVDTCIEKRKKIFEKYSKTLSNCEDLTLIRYSNDVKPCYSYYPVIVNKCCKYSRDQLFDLLDKCGIQTRKYFYPLTSEFKCIRETYYSKTPRAKDISERVLCLPMFADLSLDLVDYVIDTLSAIIK